MPLTEADMYKKRYVHNMS